MKRTEVLVLDDSLFIREILHKELERDVSIKVVAKAADAYEARDRIIEFKPDILICDIIMERMSGTEFVKKLLPQYYLPVIMISSDPALRGEAEKIDTVSFIQKPNESNGPEMDIFFRELIVKIKEIAAREVTPFATAKIHNKIIAIGASTGGAEALEALLQQLPPVMPPIVISQHMPARFTRSFSQRLNSVCKLSVKEAESGDVLIPGQVYIAPGGQHMSVRRFGGRLVINCEPNTLDMRTCPCIDVLFDSVVPAAGANSIGVILTGMGRDGAAGLLQMREAGSRTIGQDEKTSIVYGMPKAAFETGAVEMQLPLGRIAPRLVELSLAE